MEPEPPRISVEVADRRPGPAPGVWQVTWRLRNLGPHTLAVETAWVPHGRFRGEGRLSLSPVPRVAPNETLSLELPVHAHEEPGTTVENAFLIVRVTDATGAWRVFTRLRVEFDADGAPRPVPELVTLQRLGGS